MRQERLRTGTLRTGLGRAGFWLALLALYGQVLAGLAPASAQPSARWPGWDRAAICHAGDSQVPGPAERSHDRCLLPCALCAGVQAPLPLLAAPLLLPLPRMHAAGASARAPPVAAVALRVPVPPARAPPLA